MEMKDNATAGILDMQTNILEEIREIRRRDEMRFNMEQMKQGASPAVDVDAAVISPVTGTSPNNPSVLSDIASSGQTSTTQVFNGADHYQPLSETLPPVPSGLDTSLFPGTESPLSYSSVAELSQSQIQDQELKKQLREITSQQYEGFRNTTASVIEDFTGLDTMSMSSEDISKHLARRTHGIERLGGDVITGAIGIGGTAASMFMPVGAGLAVGGIATYGTKEMSEGAKTALDIQDILLEDGHKAFNVFQSTGDYGALGIGRKDRQDISKDIRHLAVDEFLEDDEIMSILQGSLDYKLLRSTQDADTFKNKFAEIVKTTKHVAATLGTSLEEAQGYIDEFNKQGIDLDEMKNLTAHGKIGASFTGEEAGDYISGNLRVASELTQGTSIAPEHLMKNMGYNTAIISSIEGMSEEDNPEMFRYIKNMGGAGELSHALEREKMSYLVDKGAADVVALYGDAFFMDEDNKWRLDDEKLSEILTSGESVQERLSKSAAHERSFSTQDIERLTREVTESTYQGLNSYETNAMIMGINEHYQQTAGIDADQAFFHMGLTSEENRDALKLREMIYGAGSNPEVVGQLDSLALQEQLDTAYRQDRPGWWKRTKFAVKSKFGTPLGDAGQYATQKVGDFAKKNINDRLTDMTDKERSDLLDGRTLSREERTENAEELKKHFEDAGLKTSDSSFEYEEKDDADEFGLDSQEKLTKGTYQELLDKAENQTLSFEELEELEKDKGWGSGASWSRKAQSYNIRRKATGEGNFITGAFAKSYAWGASLFNSTEKSDYSGSDTPVKDLEKQQKKLTKDFEKKEKAFRETLAEASGMSSEDKDTIWSAIQDYKRGEDVDLSSLGVSMSGDVSKEFDEITDLLEKSTAAKSAEKILSADTLSAQVAMDSTANIFQLLKASGGISEEEYMRYYMADENSVRKRIKKEKKKMNKMSVGQREEMLDKYENIAVEALERSGEEGMMATAQLLIDNTPGLDLEDLIVDDQLSAEKIYEASMNISKSSYEGTSKIDELLGGDSNMGASIEGLSEATEQVASAIEANNEGLRELAMQTEENFSVVYDSLKSIEQNKNDYVTSRMG